MKGLYRNELLKLIAQNSFKVILIIALALSLLAPGAILGLEGLFQVTVERWDDVEFYEEMKNSTTDKVEKAWYSASIDSRVYFVEHGYSNEDWIYAEYFDEYEEIARLICAYRLIEEGTPYEQVTNWFGADSGYTSKYSAKPFTIPGAWAPAVEGDEDGEWIENPDFAPPTKAQAKEYRLLLEGEKEAMEDKLMKVTIAEYFTDRASESREKKAAVEARLAALTEQLPGAKTPPEIQGINYEIEKAKLEAKCAEEVAQSYEEGAKQGYDYTDWHVSAGTAVRERIYQSLAGAVVMGPAVYEYEGHYDNTDNGGDYDGYKKRQQTAYEDAALALEMLDYSLENDLPVDGGTDDRLGGKAGMFSAMGLSVSVTTLFLIVAAGMSVAREHSDGTIRLLLIRPRTRGKILLSKYLALLTYGGGLLLVSFLVQGVIFTLRSPMELLGGSAVCLFGGIVQLPALLHLFWQMLLLSAGAWVLMTVALFFSVVTRRSALSILLPILVNAAAGTVSLVTVFLIQSFPKAGFLRYTILPYLDIEPFLHTPLDGYLGGSAALFFGEVGNAAAGMCFPAGFAQILLAGALFTFFAFYLFRRQQIKS